MVRPRGGPKFNRECSFHAPVPEPLAGCRCRPVPAGAGRLVPSRFPRRWPFRRRRSPSPRMNEWSPTTRTSLAGSRPSRWCRSTRSRHRLPREGEFQGRRPRERQGRAGRDRPCCPYRVSRAIRRKPMSPSSMRVNRLQAEFERTCVLVDQGDHQHRGVREVQGRPERSPEHARSSSRAAARNRQAKPHLDPGPAAGRRPGQAAVTLIQATSSRPTTPS